MIDKDGNTPLHRAVIDDMPETVSILLKEFSEDRNRLNFLGYTPSKLALLLGRSRCLNLLVEEKEQFYTVKLRGADSPETVTEQRFGELMGIRPLRTLCFADYNTLKIVTRQIFDGLERDQITEEAKWTGAFYQPEISLAIIPDVTIAWIDADIGYGVFANRDFKKGVFFGIYSGYVKRFPWYSLTPNEYCFRYPTRYWAWRRYTVDAEQSGNHTRYFNHSASPNLECLYVYCKPLLYLIFKSVTDIRKGDQLLFDYGPDYWKNRKVPRSI